MSRALFPAIDLFPAHHSDHTTLAALLIRAIPGNERAIIRLVNHLVRRGARVVQESSPPCHVSGHASQEELKMMMAEDLSPEVALASQQSASADPLRGSLPK